MELWNKAKRKYQESDSDSAIGTSRMSTTNSDYSEVYIIILLYHYAYLTFDSE